MVIPSATTGPDGDTAGSAPKNQQEEILQKAFEPMKNKYDS